MFLLLGYKEGRCYLTSKALRFKFGSYLLGSESVFILLNHWLIVNSSPFYSSETMSWF
jgi:hypothetical protein